VARQLARALSEGDAGVDSQAGPEEERGSRRKGWPLARTYIPNERWSLRFEDGLLVLSAGADELYVLEDATTETGAELAAAWEEGSIDVDSLSHPAHELLTQLLAAGIIGTEPAKDGVARVALQVVGDRVPALEQAIAAALAASDSLTHVALELSELAVYVRTNGRLMDVYDETPEWQLRPHLLLDAAFDHTISLGPLVFPGDTACLGCLAGRIVHYWGDLRPPPEPATLRHPTLIASLLALELEKVAAGDVGLVNTTIAWDVRSWQINRNAVYKLPWCPLCGELDPPEAVGSIDLPRMHLR
jgi:bacteriocin biosynthesis cyclodehydratase domain-containing protein